MSESQHLAVIRVWAAAAWADGTIAKPEAAAMRKLIDASKELSAADRETALDFLEHKVELEPNAVAGMSEEARQGIYRAAVRLSRIDREVADAELTFLERLRLGLGLDEPAARKIEATVPPTRG